MNKAENNTRPHRQVEQDYLDNLFGTALEPQARAATHTIVDRDKPLDCQLVQAAGLKLALPVSAYSQVLTDIADIEPAADADSLLAGYLRHDDQRVDVINLAAVVLDGHKPALNTPADIRDAGIILLLRDGTNALLCEQLAERMTVAPDRLRWREAHSRRTWLAATARLDGFALLDVDGILRLLESAASTDALTPADGKES